MYKVTIPYNFNVEEYSLISNILNRDNFYCFISSNKQSDKMDDHWYIASLQRDVGKYDSIPDLPCNWSVSSNVWYRDTLENNSTLTFNSKKSKTVESQLKNKIRDITNKIYDMQVPCEDYPSIKDKARDISCIITESIYSKFLLNPERIEPSIEGGIALVYRNRTKFFNKKELFIEVYNDGTFIMMLHKNYKKIFKIEELEFVDEEIIHKYIGLLTR